MQGIFYLNVQEHAKQTEFRSTLCRMTDIHVKNMIVQCNSTFTPFSCNFEHVFQNGRHMGCKGTRMREFYNACAIPNFRNTC